jgi:hypothetical protein
MAELRLAYVNHEELRQRREVQNLRARAARQAAELGILNPGNVQIFITGYIAGCIRGIRLAARKGTELTLAELGAPNG